MVGVGHHLSLLATNKASTSALLSLSNLRPERLIHETSGFGKSRFSLWNFGQVQQILYTYIHSRFCAY